MKYTNKSYFDKAKEKEEEGNYDEALEYYEKALEEDDENIEAYFSINLIKSYIEIEKNTQDKEKPNKHTKLFNVLNDFLDNDRK
ncbi:tetratricopeptide repeat protein [Brachyspira innocens]|uniref:tetratricopeptide repeat protein n=1 Tax=Brachyspira innocens TaxID=13264 RepID=UPI00036101BF|nr:tetratricopeptide repeat protein [Brachyspira innocens]